jgi:ERCC4-type nuclease
MHIKTDSKKHIILCDTREQRRLEFHHPDIARTKRQKLDAGDYCICFSDGFRPPVIFERKSIGDLFGSLSRDYPRIKEEISRAYNSGTKLIFIIEGSLSRILRGYIRSKVSGHTIIRTLFSLWVRYGVVPVFCKDRDEMSFYITEYYLALWRKRQGLKLSKGVRVRK